MNVQNLVVMIHGAPTSGKTETARLLCPPARFNTFDDDNISWEHYYFAAPLKDMLTTKKQISGKDALQRQLWMIDQALRELGGPTLISYDDYVELVYAIAEMDVQSDRSFCLDAGALVNKLYGNTPFAQRVLKQVRLHQHNVESQVNNEEPHCSVSIISDLRQDEEYSLFKDLNVLKIKLDVSEAVQRSRIFDRENKAASHDELNHPFMVSPFDDDFFDLIIDTDDISIKDQASIIKQAIYLRLGVNQYAQSQSL